MITYFKKRNISKKRIEKNNNTLNTKLESVGSIVIIGATSTSISIDH